jgi:hypothetical protein
MSGDELLLPVVSSLDGTEVFRAVRSSGAAIQVPVLAVQGGIDDIIATGSTTSRTLAARFADPAHVSDYGAVGDGTTDDSAAFIAALATGRRVIARKGSSYVVGGVTINGGAHLDLDGAVVKPASGASYMFKVTGYRPRLSGVYCQDNGNCAKQTTLSAGASTSATTITVTSATGWAVGQQVFVMLDTGRVHRSEVTVVAGTTITLADALPSDAASGNAAYASFGLIFVDDCTWFGIEDTHIVNGWVGIVMSPSATKKVAKGFIRGVQMSGARIAGIIATADVHDIHYSDIQIWGGVTKTTTATGDGVTTTYAWADTVYLLRDISATVAGVSKVITTDWTYATGKSLTFLSAPANGAAVSISHFTDGYFGIVVDITGTIDAGGAHFFNNCSVLDMQTGWYFHDAQYANVSQCISDTCSFEPLVLAGNTYSCQFSNVFLGYSPTSIVATGTVSDCSFVGLYTKRVPAASTYAGAVGDNISIGSGCAIRLETASWSGADTQTAGAGTIAYEAAQVLMQAGSAANPSLTFAADSDTGLYRTSADDLAVTTAGVARARFNSNGLSIGTSPAGPTGRLDLIGSGGTVQINTAGDQISFSKNGFNYITAGAAAATLQIQASGASGVLTFVTNGAEWVRVTAAGSLTHRANATVIVDASSHLGLRSYTVATLPSAATAARLIYVSDGASNKRLAVSDGTNWRFPDGAVVS